jgi:hypothetical protein
MIRILMILSFYWLFLSTCCSAFSGQAEVSSSQESVRLQPLQEQQQSSCQNQQALHYHSHDSRETTLYLKPQRQLETKKYATHSFLGIKNAGIGKKITFDDPPFTWRGSKKSLEKKVFSTRSCSNAWNFRAAPATTLATSSYPTKKFYPEAKAQDSLDHDFQKALQQTKSVKEARSLLEKEF